MRGTNHIVTAEDNPELGSPPLARDKSLIAGENDPDGGITPACAGQIELQPFRNDCKRDHPRLRGTNPMPCAPEIITIGSPPLARDKYQ